MDMASLGCAPSALNLSDRAKVGPCRVLRRFALHVLDCPASCNEGVISEFGDVTCEGRWPRGHEDSEILCLILRRGQTVYPHKGEPLPQFISCSQLWQTLFPWPRL